MNSNLLKYYHDVLGIRFLPQDILSKPEASDKKEVSSFWREKEQILREAPRVQSDLLFISWIDSEHEESLFAQPHWDLFEKMKKAMGLSGIETVILEYVGSSSHELFHDLLQMKIKVAVLLKKNPERSDFKICPEFKFIETYSPQTLSQQAPLKKDTWDDLQKIMKEFKN